MQKESIFKKEVLKTDKEDSKFAKFIEQVKNICIDQEKRILELEKKVKKLEESKNE